MASVQEISAQISAFLANRLSLEQFEDWSAEYSWNIHKRADEETQAFAYQVRAILNAYSEDADENLLREELATAVLPFARSARASVMTIELVLGKPLSSAASATRAVSFRREYAVG